MLLIRRTGIIFQIKKLALLPNINHAISEFFYQKNDPTYNINGNFMQIYILHFRNSGVGSMELENAFCCPIGDICIIMIMTLWETFS